MKTLIPFFITSLVILLFSNADISAKESLLLKNVRLIDVTKAKIQEGVSILILNGRIARIGKNISMQGVPQLDVHGNYVLPGLIDSHVHLMWGPGAYLNRPEILDSKTWESTWGKSISHYLKAYLACGVTTVIDASAPVFVIQKIRKLLDKGKPGPRFLSLGEMFAPPKGYGASAINKPVTTPQEVETKLNAMQSLDVIGIKVPIERGANSFSDWPIHSPEILKAIKFGAEQRNLPIYIHAYGEKDLNTALDIGVHTLMHANDRKVLSETFIERLAHINTYQCTTLSVGYNHLTIYNLDRLNDPLLELVVPENELSIAKDPIAGENANKAMLSKRASWIPKMLQGLFINLFFDDEKRMELLQNSQKNINALNKAGVTIVMGSDTVNADFELYSFHGYSSIQEMQLLGEAGLSPKEVIKTATINPAKMTGLDRELGTIEAGKCADLIVLKDNPLNDLKAFKTIQWTIKDGVAKSPKEWMSY
jgi:imidazolonepropionase-like amidohydrolase